MPVDLQYVESEALTKDLGNKTNLFGKPKLQNAVRKALAELYGPSPDRIRVPKGAPLPNGGIYLGNYLTVGEGEDAKIKRIYQGENLKDAKPQEGGYALYRRNCLHCHGVSGPRRWPDGAVPLSCSSRLSQRGSSSSPRPPAVFSRIGATSAGRSPTASTGRPCRPSNPC